LFENFSNSGQVQARRFADLAQRQTRLARTLEGFPASDAGTVALAVNAREFRLSAFHLGAGFRFGVLRHVGSLFVAAPRTNS
jgi:hypothetical protein